MDKEILFFIKLIPLYFITFMFFIIIATIIQKRRNESHRSFQERHKMCSSTNRYITIDGVTDTIANMARKYNINVSTLRSRIRRGDTNVNKCQYY